MTIHRWVSVLDSANSIGCPLCSACFQRLCVPRCTSLLHLPAVLSRHLLSHYVSSIWLCLAGSAPCNPLNTACLEPSMLLCLSTKAVCHALALPMPNFSSKLPIHHNTASYGLLYSVVLCCAFLPAGRSLRVATVTLGGRKLLVATSHLESPIPPQQWFSRVGGTTFTLVEHAHLLFACGQTCPTRLCYMCWAHLHLQAQA